ncbi:hypothetical protein FH609_012820 [Streptomyces sp. 3MP-14]|uniref:Lipoprotein n=1 Tax=Streptomyces mimosae TaxID=2586635 RepID=A0A5N6AG86_9ACTN|nr:MULTISPECIES: hypothetical protein [Streptomyces]KAB8167255.1 hypothetical protein FH607_010270 [Streptomyces mimosae]KAB8177195.1 hypothetical protein FH609_012820 [Streptomyces sp. 3MP-14]
MLRHRLAVATALLLALTACGGGSDDNADDPIPGVDEETTAPSEETSDPEADPEPDPDATEIPLPDDVELIFDWETPDDPTEAAALEGAADYLRSIAASIVAQDPERGVYLGYAASDGARGYAREQIQAWVDNGWTMHGTDRYFDAEVAPAESGGMRAQFCGDSTGMIGKDVETGEPLSADQQIEESIYRYDVALVGAPGVEDFWQVNGIEVTDGAASCGG